MVGTDINAKAKPAQAYLRAQQEKLLRAGYSARAAGSLGALILQGLRDAPDFVLQIDGTTGQEDTCRSVLARSIHCARAMEASGLRAGDVIAIMDVTHVDLCVPLYASLYLGITAACLDFNMTTKELSAQLNFLRPKMIFCQNKTRTTVKTLLDEEHTGIKLVTFGWDFKKFCESGSSSDLDSFRAADIDPDTTIAGLLPSSGSTGKPKTIALTHTNLVSMSYTWWRSYTTFPTPDRLQMLYSTLHWTVGIASFCLSPVLLYTRLQSSELSNKVVVDIINKYKPSSLVIAPIRLDALVRYAEQGECDLTCFEVISVGGYVTPQRIIDAIKRLSPKTLTCRAYGISESTTAVFDFLDSTPGSIGRAFEVLQYRLVDTQTGQDVLEPNKNGELWIKGPTIFKGYYKDPELTAESITEDGWFKTGDIMYRDENNFYFFVDRIKSYNTFEVPAAKLEEAIGDHPGVEAVAVSAKPGEDPAACVVRRPGSKVTAQEIKDLVKAKFPESMHLAGGVLFLESLPVNSTGKLDTKTLQETLLSFPKE